MILLTTTENNPTPQAISQRMSNVYSWYVSNSIYVLIGNVLEYSVYKRDYDVYWNDIQNDIRMSMQNLIFSNIVDKWYLKK